MKSNQTQRRPRERCTSKPSTTTQLEVKPKLFVANLPADIMRYELINLFAKFGSIVDCYIRSPITRAINTYAFITYSTISQASAAIRVLDRKETFGRIMSVSYAKQKRDNIEKPMQCWCDCHKKEKFEHHQPPRQVRLPIQSNKSKPNLSIINKKIQMMSKMMKNSMSLVSMSNNNISSNYSSEEESFYASKRMKLEEKGRLKELEREREKPKPKPKNYLKPKEKEVVMLAISTDISRSQESEDFYSYEAKPFSDFCLKREEE